eukprot:4639526-Alexandrium_andersonii.AAC.1
MARHRTSKRRRFASGDRAEAAEEALAAATGTSPQDAGDDSDRQGCMKQPRPQPKAVEGAARALCGC